MRGGSGWSEPDQLSVCGEGIACPDKCTLTGGPKNIFTGI